MPVAFPPRAGTAPGAIRAPLRHGVEAIGGFRPDLDPVDPLLVVRQDGRADLVGDPERDLSGNGHQASATASSRFALKYGAVIIVACGDSTQAARSHTQKKMRRPRRCGGGNRNCGSAIRRLIHMWLTHPRKRWASGSLINRSSVRSMGAARQSGCEDGVNLDEKVSPDA